MARTPDSQPRPTGNSTDDRIARLEQSLAELASELKDQRKQNELLQRQAETPRTQREQQQLALDQRMARREEMRLAEVKKLESGEKQYHVALKLEPRWGRTVGAASADEARVKFERFAGIRGTSSENPIVVTEREAVAA